MGLIKLRRNAFHGWRGWLARAAVVGTAIVATAGCSFNGNPGAGSPASKSGELGNGTFTFRCDDSVACDRWNNVATNFPTEVAADSHFELNFFHKNESTGIIDIRINEPPENRGLRIDPVAPYAKKDSTGKFEVAKSGVATFAARDGRGWIVDYVHVDVVKPDGLVVYDADFSNTKDDPPRIASINLGAGDRRSYRTVAEHEKRALAGAILVDWTSLDENVVAIESYAGGKVTIIAKGPGKTRIQAVGAGATEEIDVEVAQ